MMYIGLTHCDCTFIMMVWTHIWQLIWSSYDIYAIFTHGAHKCASRKDMYKNVLVSYKPHINAFTNICIPHINFMFCHLVPHISPGKNFLSSSFVISKQYYWYYGSWCLLNQTKFPPHLFSHPSTCPMFFVPCTILLFIIVLSR
jgi:hypothetical protein